MSEDITTHTNQQIKQSVTDATLRSGPDTVLWGYIAANLPPALSIKSGAVVEIEALSHQGLTTQKDPERFFASYGIPGEEVLPDAKAVFSGVKRPKGASVHILTGPIYIEGAEPGDTLEVRVLDIRFRVPYGVNNTGPGKGVLPKLLKEQSAKLIRLDLGAASRTLLQRNRNSTQSVHGDHGGVTADQPWYGIFNAAGRLGRQYGFEISGCRFLTVSSSVQQRRAVFYR